MDITKYPKSRKLLEDFASKELMAIQQLMLKDIPEGIESGLPDILPEYIQQAVSHFIDTGSRTLYDFFDEQSLLVLLDGPDEMHGWSWQIRGKKVVNDPSAMSMNRKECELAAFEAAFKELEEKI